VTEVVWEGDPADLGFTDGDIPALDDGFHHGHDGSGLAVSSTLRRMRGQQRMVKVAVRLLGQYFVNRGLTSLAELPWTWKAVSENEVLFEPPEGHPFTDAYVVDFATGFSAVFWFGMNFGMPPNLPRIGRIPIEMRT